MNTYICEHVYDVNCDWIECDDSIFWSVAENQNLSETRSNRPEVGIYKRKQKSKKKRKKVYFLVESVFSFFIS